MLIEKEPELFLANPDAAVHSMALQFEVLQERLLGAADVPAIMHEQPGIVQLDVSQGLDELLQLWDVESRSDVLQNSDPCELALALRTLSEPSAKDFPWTAGHVSPRYMFE